MKNSPLKDPFQQAFYTNNAHRDYISWTNTKKSSNTRKRDNVVTSPDTTWWLPLITNVKVVSRYIALDHDTYREPPYRYCIDISPYRLIPIIDIQTSLIFSIDSDFNASVAKRDHCQDTKLWHVPTTLIQYGPMCKINTCFTDIQYWEVKTNNFHWKCF